MSRVELARIGPDALVLDRAAGGPCGTVLLTRGRDVVRALAGHPREFGVSTGAARMPHHRGPDIVQNRLFVDDAVALRRLREELDVGVPR